MPHSELLVYLSSIGDSIVAINSNSERIRTKQGKTYVRSMDGWTWNGTSWTPKYHWFRE